MNDLSHIHLHQDDQLLVDYLTGQIDEDLRESVAKRLTDDKEFAARAAKLNQLFMVMDACPTESPSQLLISRTLAAVGAEPLSSRASRREAESLSGLRPFGMRELAAVAALVFIISAIVMPVIRHSHNLYQQQLCASRTGDIGQGLTQYAASNNGQLPSIANVNAGWLNDAPAETKISNSSNLWKLVKGEYVNAASFQCPAVEVSQPVTMEDITTGADFPSGQHIAYSYHNGVNSAPLTIDTTVRASLLSILADRSPMFDAGAFNPQKLSQKNSANHDHRGQSVLFLDMSSQWAENADPHANGDNIWLARDIYNYSGVERPADEADSFLLPSFISK